MQPPGDVRDLGQAFLKGCIPSAGFRGRAVALLGDRTGDGNIVEHPNDVDLPEF
jgi:hypothetical protein